jgi:hypothetical protein
MNADVANCRWQRSAGCLAGADDSVEIEAWSEEQPDWFRRYLKLEHGIPRTTPLVASSRRLMLRNLEQSFDVVQNFSRAFQRRTGSDAPWVR